MDKRFDSVSMNGRMAYIIMCIESFLVSKYPGKDWTFVSERMWKATFENWGLAEGVEDDPSDKVNYMLNAQTVMCNFENGYTVF